MPNVAPQLVPLLNKLQKVKFKSNGGLLAACPSHQDNNPSLSIDYRDGRTLVKCMAGCSVEQVMAAIGLTMDALFEDNAQQQPGKPTKGPGKRKVYKINYTDDIITHIRLDYEDGTKTFFWETNGTTGLRAVKVSDLPLYGEWDLHAAIPFLIICEGEKCQEAIARCGLNAISTYGADAIPSTERLKTLSQHAIFLWPDNDPPGARHMDIIADLLTSLNCPPLIIHWPDAPPKGDAYDYIALGLDVNELLGNAKLWEDSWIHGARVKTGTQEARTQGHDFDHLL